nr:EVE domain-containing protein [Cytophagales bacterium]
MNYWLVKTEPESYSLDDLKRNEEDCWDGVRNYQARNFIEKMNIGDLVFVYHSGKQKSLVGLAEVASVPFSDPKAPENEKWLAVMLRYSKHLQVPLSLAEIKSNPELQDMALLKQSRLSVMAVAPNEAATLLKLTQS